MGEWAVVIQRLSVLGRAAAWTIAGVGGWLGYQLLVQNGRLLLRIEALEEELAALTEGPESDSSAPSGLPVGSAFFDFALPTLSGGTMTLSDWWGRHVLLIFFDPECEFCLRMLPDLARLEPDPEDGRPVPLVVSTGDTEANRKLMDSAGVRCPVLLQERNEVAQLCWVDGTPMGYLLDERGATASPLAVGAEAILALANARPLNGTGAGEHVCRSENGYTQTRVSSAPSSPNKRDGLPTGTKAPDFRLPRVDGGELSLDQFRGQRVLLVFSDPECEFCDELAPKLRQFAGKVPDIQILIISRGRADANRTAIIEHGPTIPVVLQHHWEISRAYGILATPIAYLIDDAGTIAAPVAVGIDKILALAMTSNVPIGRRRGGGVLANFKTHLGLGHGRHATIETLGSQE
jgi:peroxiredoxin